MNGNGSGELLRFGPFEIDPAKEELRRSGLVVRISPQPFRILLLLVRRAGEVVTRDDLQAAIWGSETYVDFEHGINSAIRQIRFVLGDRAEVPRYVRTLPRRGYSFIASVERVARPGHADAIEVAQAIAPVAPPVTEPVVPAEGKRLQFSRRVSAIAAAASIAIVTMLTLIAQTERTAVVAEPGRHAFTVLPFQRLGPAITGIDDRSFAEEVRATIGRLPPAHISLIESADGQDSPRRADVVVGGSIHKSEDGIRVIVSLADAASRTQIWSETIQRPGNRKEGMAVEVAHRVMKEVAQRYLPPPRHEPLLVTSASPAAVDLYRRARVAHERAQAYDWMRTRELYEATVKADPRFAEAWSGLGDVFINQVFMGPRPERDRAAAQAADCARRAIALQPNNAEAHSTLALLAAQRDYDLAAAEDLLRRAVAADPKYVDARANLAIILAMRGAADDSLREFAAAQQLDPAMLDVSTILPMLYFNARRYEDARAGYREYLAIDPQSRQALWGLLTTYIAQKSWPDAIALAGRVGQVPVEGIPNTEAGFLQVYRGLEPFMQRGRRQGPFTDYSLALYYGQLGDHDRAFALLHQAIDQRVPVLSYIMVDPRMDVLRGDPRYREVTARMKLGQPPAREKVGSAQPKPP